MDLENCPNRLFKLPEIIFGKDVPMSALYIFMLYTFCSVVSHSFMEAGNLLSTASKAYIFTGDLSCLPVIMLQTDIIQ